MIPTNFSSPHESMIAEYCKKFVPTIANKPSTSNDQQLVLNSFLELLSKHNLTLNSLTSVSQCIAILTRLLRHTNESTANDPTIYSPTHSKSLIVFVVLIALVSFISIVGNLCLAKVLYSKRHRLMQTDRIVLCLALSELCLVLIDSPTEIYRFLSPSYTEEWLCPFHTFFEAFFSSCIIFYHLLGAFDRFVYIHGHTSSETLFWSRWSRRLSSQSGSIILLIVPLIFSLPLAICNALHARVFHASIDNKICLVQYTHGILIGFLTSFYLLPLFFSFVLHGKLIYFIRQRHNRCYFMSTEYVLTMQRTNTVEFQSKRRTNKDQLLLQPRKSPRRRLNTTNTDILASSTSTTTLVKQSMPINLNNSSNSSQSSRSSTATGSTPITSPIVLYKINSQATANANRTVLLLVLLLSFYVCCWAPYNIYIWLHVYFLAQSSLQNDSNLTFFMSFTTNLRRIIYINYSLYLLSIISMCFSFIFYFSMNKQARQEFSRLMGCICPSISLVRNDEVRRNYPQLPYRPRYPFQYSYKNERIKTYAPSIFDARFKHLGNGAANRRALNYGCQIQCCP